MKKIFSTVLVALAATLSFTSCEDVPAPYDVPTSGGGNGGSQTTLNTIYSETFDNNATAFSFKNVTLSEGLTYVWRVSSYNDNGYLNASAFAGNASHASESWAVSPAISLADSKEAVLSFKHAINKLNDTSTMTQMMTAWASTDYAGDVASATWTQLTIPTYPAGTSWTFVESGDIDLTAYCGKSVYIAFRYTSTDSNSGGWEVDNFTVKGDGTPMEQPSTPDTPDTPDTPEASKGLTLDATNGIVTMVNDGVEEGETQTFDVKDMGIKCEEGQTSVNVTSVTLADGTVITFDGGEETNKPKFFESYGSIRIYKNNGFTITGKSKIAKVVFTCDGASYVGNATATLAFSGNDLTYNNLYTETVGGGTQLRFKAIAITYAK